MMSPADKKRLRAQAHSLKPVVMAGQSGLTDNVHLAIEEALDHHELIKVRLRSQGRSTRMRQAEEISSKTGANLVQLIGQIAVIYRKKDKKKK